MAVFNPETNVGGMPDFTGASRGQIPNKAFGELFEGLGQAVGLGVRSADQAVQENIRKDVYSIYDQVNDDFGIEAATVQSNDAMNARGQPELPQDLKDATGQLDLLNQAYKSGRLKSYHYWGRLENEVKSLRAKYPGYREQIDNIVADITGNTPANALRSELMQEMEANTKAGSENDNFIRQNSNYMSPANHIRWLNGDLSDEEALVEIQTKRSAQTNLDQLSAQVSLDVATGNDPKSNAKKLAETKSDQMLSDIFNNKMSEVGKNYSEIKSTIDLVLKDGQITGEEDTQLRQLVTNFELQVNEELEKMLMTPLEGGAGSLNSLLSVEDRNAVRKKILDQVAVIKDSVTNKQTGILTWVKSAYDADAQTDVNNIVNSDNVFKVARALQTMGLSEYMNTIFTQGGSDSLSQFAEAFIKLATGKIAIGETNDQGTTMTASEYIEQAKEIKEAKPEVIKTFIDQLTTLASDPEAPPEIVKNVIKSLFSPENNDFLKYFEVSNHKRLFTQLVNPAITERVWSLSQKTNEPELWTMYTNWVVDQWPTLLSDQANQVQNYLEQFPNALRLQYDPDSNQFDLLINNTDEYSMEQVYTVADVAQVFLVDVNDYLKLLEPIMEHDKVDRVRTLERMMQMLGLDAMYPEDENGPGSPDDRDSTTGRQQGSLGTDAYQLANSLPFGRTEPNALYDRVAFRDMLATAEGADYDTFFGGSNQGFTGMTVQAVYDYQNKQQSEQNLRAAPVGRYQIVGSTMKTLMDNGILTPDELFDKDAQDRAADFLLARRGYDRFLSGKMNKQDFLTNLRDEWASIGVTEGGKAIEALFNDEEPEYAASKYYTNEDLRNDRFKNATMNPKMLKALDAVTEMFGKKFRITSAFRSSKYNQKVSFSKDSQHSHGTAVDIDVKGMSDVEKSRLIAAFIKLGAKGFGHYSNGTIHVDFRDSNGKGPGGLALWFNRNQSYKDGKSWFTKGIELGLSSEETGQQFAFNTPVASDADIAPWTWSQILVPQEIANPTKH